MSSAWFSMNSSAHRSLGAFVASTVLLLAGCNDDPDPDAGATFSFYGSYADTGGTIGTMTFSGTPPMPDDGEACVRVTGSFRRTGGGQLPVSGWYCRNPYPNEVVLDTTDAGTGAEYYVFDGSIFPGQDVGMGNAGGPAGNGFFAVFLRGGSTVRAYCGVVTCTAPAGCTTGGPLIVTTMGSKSTAVLSLAGGVGVAVGTVQSGAVVIDVDVGVDLTLTGQVSGTSVAGTWLDSATGQSGNWSGTTGSCP